MSRKKSIWRECTNYAVRFDMPYILTIWLGAAKFQLIALCKNWQKYFIANQKVIFNVFCVGARIFIFGKSATVSVSVSKMVEISINSHRCIIKLSTQTDQQQQRRQKQIAKTNKKVWPERVFLHALSNTIFPTATHYSVFNAFSHKRKHCLHRLFHSH